MFNNLIESQSHRKEFKRRGRFLLATTAVYSLVFVVAGIASIYAYDARLDAQNDELALLSWVPPVPPAPVDQQREIQPPRRSFTPTAPVDPKINTPERTIAVARTDNPQAVPETVGTNGSDAPPADGSVNISQRNVDPPASSSGDKNGCTNCPANGNGPATGVEVKPTPEPTPVKPKTETLPSRVLVSKAISLPQPPYPQMARQIHLQGAVVVQILVDETGRVVSAQVVSGNPMLGGNAKDAALRARFTPTTLNGQPVKVQGVITYNFVLH